MATTKADAFLAKFEEKPKASQGGSAKAEAFLAKFETETPQQRPARDTQTAPTKAEAFLAKFETEPEQKQLPAEIGFGRQATSLVAEIAAGEAGRMASTAAGAALGAKLGSAGFLAGPLGIATAAGGALLGGAIGFVTGGLATGALASAGAQRFIEGREEVNMGRVARDALINTVPIIGKAGRGLTLGQRALQTGAKHAVIGGTIGAGGQMVETAINEGRLAKVQELAAPTLLGVGLGGGLGVTAEFASRSYRRLAKMDQEQMTTAIMRGDPEAIALANAIEEAAPRLAERANLPVHKRVLESIKDLAARQIPSWRLGGKVSRDLGNYNDQVARGQARTLANVVDASLRTKTLAKTVQLSSDLPASGVRLGDDIVVMPGEILKRGSEKHNALVSYTAGEILEGRRFTDLVTGKLQKPSIVGSEAGKQVVRWQKGDAPKWLGDEAMGVLGEAKRAFRESAQEMLNLHHAEIRELPKELAEKIARSINEDSYLPRIYRFFTEEAYTPSPRVTNNLMKHLTTGENAISEADARKFLAELNRKKALDPIDAMAMLTGGRVGAFDVLKKRTLTDKDKVFREYLGEVLNPAERLGEGFLQVQRYIAETKASIKVAESLFMAGQAKMASQISPDQMSLYAPLRIGGVEMRADGVRPLSKNSTVNIPTNLKAVMAGGDIARGGEVSSLTGAAAVEAVEAIRDRNVIMVPVEFQRAINQATGEGVKSITQGISSTFFGKKFMQTVAISKMMKVPFNPPAYAIQGYGSMFSTFTNGFNPLNIKFLGKSGKIIRWSSKPNTKDLLDAANGIGLDKLLDLQRRGLIDRNTLSRDMNDILGSAERNASLIRKGFQKISDAYSFQDDLWRIANFFEHEKLVAKATRTELNLAGISAKDIQKFGLQEGRLFGSEEVADVAQFFTRQFYQNYPQLNRFLRDMSQLGVIGQFASFGLELARNYSNKFAAGINFANGRFVKRALMEKKVDLLRRGMDERLADRLIAQAQPQMERVFRRHGATMLANQAMAFGGTIAGITAWNMSRGIDKEMEESMREIVYPWDRNANLAFDFDGERRNMRWKNVSYLMEMATHTNVVQSAFRGDTHAQKLMNVFGAMLAPFASDGMFVLKNLYPAINNYDPRVRKAISVSPNPFVRALEQSSWYISDTFMPGFIREYDRATADWRDQAIGETLLRQVGLRWNSRNLDDLVRSRVVEISQLLNTSRSNLAFDLRRLPANMHDAAYEKHNQQYHENFQASIRLAKAVTFMEQRFNPDFNPDQTIRILRDAGMPAREALFAVKGELPNLNRAQTETPSDKWDEIYKLPANQRRAAINEITDVNMRRDVMRRYQRNLRDERVGISEEQKVLRAMRTEERASAIFDMMQGSSNPEALLQDLRRKRVVSANVDRQIRLLQRQGG